MPEINGQMIRWANDEYVAGERDIDSIFVGQILNYAEVKVKSGVIDSIQPFFCRFFPFCGTDRGYTW